MSSLRVIIVKPSKYDCDGFVERFARGFMPNSTLPHLASLTLGACRACDVRVVDEYVQTDLAYLSLLHGANGVRTLVVLAGVQSHQLHRALDLGAYAVQHGCTAVIGGPHPMTCDTTMLQGRGIAFALSEAELVWESLLSDAATGRLQPVYGRDQRWQRELESPVLRPPSRRDLRRYAVPMIGIYPARGCPYSCNFCSVIKIAGHQVRTQAVTTTLASLRAAKAAGVRLVMFTSDNFNKYPEVFELLDGMIAERINLPFFAQCDAQIYRQEDLVQRMARAGCHQMFVGVESFDTRALRDAHKLHNDPRRYAAIVRLCREHGITSHFSNIIGFPTDTRSTVLEHLSVLQDVAPDVASFYLLTPIPGTDQYDEFRRSAWLTETNLDRFDGTCATWRHPHLTDAELQALLFTCYRKFYGVSDVMRKMLRLLSGQWDFRLPSALFAVAGLSLLSRLASARRTHPMAGGIRRVRLDRASDYSALRQRVYGIEHVPLPASLPLSTSDQEINRGAKLPQRNDLSRPRVRVS